MKGWKGIAGLLGIAVVVMAGVGVACGGGGGEKVEGPEDYARAFCEALGKHADDFTEVMGGMEDIEDIQDVGELQEVFSDMAPVLEGMAEDLDKIDPPADVGQVHESIFEGRYNAGSRKYKKWIPLLVFRVSAKRMQCKPSSEFSGFKWASLKGALEKEKKKELFLEKWVSGLLRKMLT